jgi:transposase
VEDAQIIAKKDKEISELKEELTAIKFQHNQLLKLIYGSKSEKYKLVDPAANQLNIFGNQVDQADEKEESIIDVNYKRKKNNNNHPGRNALPDHLPVIEEVIEPQIDTAGLEKIAEEITETLEYTPASLVKKRTIRPKYLDRKKESFHIAELPARPIPKGIAEASLLAHIMVSKFVDHLPLYRQEKIYLRDFGWKVAQSTMVDWVKGCCELLEPLYEKLISKVLESGYIQADESPIKVLEKPKGKGKSPPKKVMRGYQWVYYEPINKMVYFNYRSGRGMNGPKEVLRDYTGYVQCDGYSVYDGIASKNEGITLLGCLVHARRYFEKALDSDKTRASYILELIQKIYQSEAIGKKGSIDEHQEIRTFTILPLLKQIEEYIQEEAIKILPKSPIGKGMTYFNNHKEKIIRAATDVRYELDNNQIENCIRPLALGRKNYLFGGSHAGGKRIAMMYSFLGTCKVQGINPRKWLESTLKKIPTHPINRIEELLPGY